MYIKHIGTNFIIVNPLIKGLPPTIFRKHTIHMGVISIDDMQFRWEFVFGCHSVVDIFYEYFLQNKVYVSVLI